MNNTPEEPAKKKRKMTTSIVLRNTEGIQISKEAAQSIITGWAEDKKNWETEAEVQHDAMERLGKVASKWVHKGAATLYGSRMTGIGVMPSCDFDVSISWPGYQEGAIEGDALNKKIVKLCKTLHHKGFKHATIIPSKRVPLVTCKDVTTGCHIDITLNNQHGVKNSMIFKTLVKTLPELAPCLWIMKKIGKSRGFLNPSGGYISTYCLLTMMLIAAQTAGHMPLLPAPSALESTTLKSSAKTPSPPEAERVASILASFLTLFHTTSFLCFSADSAAPSPSTLDTPLFVADILDGSNCARTLTQNHWMVLVNEMGRLVDKARNGDALQTWDQKDGE
eukprot:TRINITY_DN17510_c0_g1_i1.p1 TRINITY_DN17510_c0_g1~~TRINITY_DN17510_c0_g1_i1.p1  ORF type:complete len:349 (+),score=93.27 TRINITY_DN17510_c0_g1_i1:42-1049(+)